MLAERSVQPGFIQADCSSVCSVLQRMLRRNPLAALAMHRAGLPRQSLQEEAESHHAEQVLGSCSELSCVAQSLSALRAFTCIAC